MTENKRFSYEIEKFKKELGQYNRTGLIKLLLEMKEENVQLKQALSDEKHLNKLELDQLKEIMGKLADENEQLKKANHDLTKIVEKYNQLLKELDYD